MRQVFQKGFRRSAWLVLKPSQSLQAATGALQMPASCLPWTKSRKATHGVTPF